MKSRLLICLVLGLWMPSCGGGPPRMEVLPEGAEPCVLHPAEGPAPRLIRIGLAEPVLSSRAPVPANEAERMVFRHLFETLVTLDCRGEIHPGLAREWSVDDSGREWRFELRENARWSDGMRVTAEEIRRSWQQNRTLALGEAPWIWIDPDSIRTMGEDVLLVALSRSLGDSPRAFAHPALAAAKRASTRGWPQGSGPYLVSLERGRILSLIANPYSGAPYRAPLEFRVHPRADPRDLLAQGADAVLTGAKDALDYAAELPGMSVSEAAIERGYLLLSRRASPPEERGDALMGFRRDLARNVMTSDAEAFHMWIQDCDTNFRFLRPRPGWGGHPVSSRIVYLEGDADARVLAQRLLAVSLSSVLGSSDSPFPLTVPERSGVVAVPLSSHEFTRALRSGREWAFVTSVRFNPFGPCLDTGELLLAAPWLLDSGSTTAESVIPLVTVRRRLVARVSLANILRDGDGVFLFDHAGWVESEDTP